jgi:hypothetical protein
MLVELTSRSANRHVIYVNLDQIIDIHPAEDGSVLGFSVGHIAVEEAPETVVARLEAAGNPVARRQS